MSRCWCGVVLGLLVAGLAWCPAGFVSVALTVLGVLIAIKFFTGKCCCKDICKSKCETPQSEDTSEVP